MGSRTVRLSSEAELALRRVVRATGLSISAVLTKGVLALSEEISRRAAETSYEIYARLDLGPWGDAIAASTDTRRAVRRAIRRKLGRAR
jgi:hypothetical protein